MRKLLIFTMLILMIGVAEAATSGPSRPPIDERDRIIGIPNPADRETNDIYVTQIIFEDAEAGKPSMLRFRIYNDNFESQNARAVIKHGAKHTEDLEFDLGTVEADENYFLTPYLNYPEPGQYVGKIILSHDEGEEEYDIEADVSPYSGEKAPVVYDIPDIEFDEDGSYELDLSKFVTDADGDEVTWSVNSNIVNINGNIATITPDKNWNGEEEVTFTASDGTLEDSETINVRVNPVNDAPIVSNIPDIEFDEDTIYELDLSQYVTDDDEVTWSVNSNIVNINGNIATITPDKNWNGEEEVTFTASDGTLEDSETINVRVNPVNDAPIVSNIPDVSFTRGGSHQIDLSQYVTDVDSQVTWSAESSDVDVSINGNIATISSPIFYGEEEITFTASDGTLEDSDSVLVTIARGNNAPVVSDIPDIEFETGDSHEIILSDYVTDGDNDDITWSVSGNTELNVDIVEGVATLSASTPTVETITFTADDSFDTASDDVIVTVNEKEYSISGNIINIFSEDTLSGASISVDGIETTTDSNGQFLLLTTETGYLEVLIEKDGYTSRQSWVEVDSDVEKDFSLVPDTFDWNFYTETFRTYVAPINRLSTVHWKNPPSNITIFNDTTYVDIDSVEANVNTSLYNIRNILPTFNPVETADAEIQVFQEKLRKSYPGELFIGWDNRIGAAGTCSMLMDENEATILSAAAIFMEQYHPTNPNSQKYNQELGTCFGAVREPTSISPYDSVFTDPSGVYSYTSLDLKAVKIYLNRSRMHYYDSTKGDFAYDREAHPDIVEQYYSGNTLKSSKEQNMRFVYYEDGIKHSYDYDNVPQDVKEMFPSMFNIDKKLIVNNEPVFVDDEEKTDKPAPAEEIDEPAIVEKTNEEPQIISFKNKKTTTIKVKASPNKEQTNDYKIQAKEYKIEKPKYREKRVPSRVYIGEVEKVEEDIAKAYDEEKTVIQKIVEYFD